MLMHRIVQVILAHHPVLRKSRLGNARSATCSISLSRVSKTPCPQENRPVSVFKWVSVDAPVKVKEVSPSNIETADHVGKYKVELGVMKKKGSS